MESFDETPTAKVETDAPRHAWTVEGKAIWKDCNAVGVAESCKEAKAIANDHNASLKKERETRESERFNEAELAARNVSLNSEIQQLRTQLAAAQELMSEARQWHSDKDSPDYNDCDKSPCMWCDQSQELGTDCMDAHISQKTWELKQQLAAAQAAIIKRNQMLVACGESAAILKRVNKHGGWQKAEQAIIDLVNEKRDTSALDAAIGKAVKDEKEVSQSWFMKHLKLEQAQKPLVELLDEARSMLPLRVPIRRKIDVALAKIGGK